MRLIDAEELKKEISKRISQKIKWTMEPDVYSFRADEIVELIDSVPVLTNIDVIKAFPSIVNRPGGEWLYNDYGNGCGNWHCSICGHMPYYATKYMRFLNFCPNCGADLRGWTNDS